MFFILIYDAFDKRNKQACQGLLSNFIDCPATIAEAYADQSAPIRSFAPQLKYLSNAATIAKLKSVEHQLAIQGTAKMQRRYRPDFFF